MAVEAFCVSSNRGDEKAMIVSAARLISGEFTPCFLPPWDHQDIHSLNAWFNGESFSEARERLESYILEEQPNSQSVHLFSSGRSALYFAFKILKEDKRSEVIIPSFCCSSVPVAALQNGLQPVLADCDLDFNLSFESVRENTSHKTLAIVVPHMSGNWVAGMDEIQAWAKKNKIFIIEDCAQSPGLTHREGVAGDFGDLAVFSAGPTKNIFGVGGGWLVINNPSLVGKSESIDLPLESQRLAKERINKIRSSYLAPVSSRGRRVLAGSLISRVPFRRNSQKRTWLDYQFAAYSMNDLEAEIALSQMKKLKKNLMHQKEMGEWWLSRIQLILGITAIGDMAESTFPRLIVRVSDVQKCSEVRQVFWKYGVESEATYVPLHLRPEFSHFVGKKTDLIDSLWRGGFSLPTRFNLNERDLARFERSLTALREVME